MRNECLWHDKIQFKVMQRLLPPRVCNELSKYTVNTSGIDMDQSAYIYGKSGTGKTLLAAKLQLEYEMEAYLNNKPFTSTFINSGDLFHQLKNEFGKDAVILDELCKLDLLVLDDIGTVKPSDWVYQTTYQLINHRYEQNLPIIFTSNFSLLELERFFGDDRIPQRINRMCKIYNKSAI